MSDFVAPAGGERESMLVREGCDGEIELLLLLPQLHSPPDLDGYCQIIEGVSHFLHLAERARCELPTTHLELELQAEIDKYVVLVLLHGRFDRQRARVVFERLYERVRYIDEEGTAKGDRYRLANVLAAKVVRRIEHMLAGRGTLDAARASLARFYRVGQCEKIQLAYAA